MLTARESASVGPRDLKKPGTVDWAWQTLSALKRHWELKELSVRQFEGIVAELAEHRAWELVPPDEPYGSLDALLKAEIGETADAAKAKLGKQGRPKKGEGKGSDTTFLGRGSVYLRARLERDHPKILKALDVGKYPSVRAAAIAAGIVKVPSAMDLLKRAWAKAGKKDREAFLQWVCEQGV